MAKIKTIQEKREEMEKALMRLSAFESIINKAERDMKYEYMAIKCDDEGKPIEDAETGEWLYEEPSKDRYNYDEYVAYKSALEEIKALV